METNGTMTRWAGRVVFVAVLALAAGGWTQTQVSIAKVEEKAEHVSEKAADNKAAVMVVCARLDGLERKVDELNRKLDRLIQLELEKRR